jgi:hypothetical protein
VPFGEGNHALVIKGVNVSSADSLVAIAVSGWSHLILQLVVIAIYIVVYIISFASGAAFGLARQSAPTAPRFDASINLQEISF